MNHTLVTMLLGNNTPELNCFTAVVGESEDNYFSRPVVVCEGVYLPEISTSEVYEKLSKYFAGQADFFRKIETENQ